MPAKLYRGEHDADNEGIVDLLVEKLDDYLTGAGYPVEVESVHSGIRKDKADWEKQFAITVDVAELFTPGDQTDLDQKDRKVWRRLGVNQPVFDVSLVALVIDRGPDYDKPNFWGVITQMTVVITKSIFGPGTRPATVIYSDDVPEAILRQYGAGQARFFHFTVPAYFDKQSYGSAKEPELKGTYPPASRPLMREYTGDWPPIQLWKRVVGNGVGRTGRMTYLKNLADDQGVQQIVERGTAPPPY